MVAMTALKVTVAALAVSVAARTTMKLGAAALDPEDKLTIAMNSGKRLNDFMAKRHPVILASSVLYVVANIAMVASLVVAAFAWVIGA